MVFYYNRECKHIGVQILATQNFLISILLIMKFEIEILSKAKTDLASSFGVRDIDSQICPPPVSMTNIRSLKFLF